MSYDVGIAGEEFNYTSNLAGLFYDHIPDAGNGGGLYKIHGLTGRQAACVLAEFFERVHQTKLSLACIPKFYNPANGWGSVEGTLIFAARILAACAKHPRHRVWVSR